MPIDLRAALPWLLPGVIACAEARGGSCGYSGRVGPRRRVHSHRPRPRHAALPLLGERSVLEASNLRARGDRHHRSVRR